MENPIIANCAEGAWTLVAGNLVKGDVHTLGDAKVSYFITYRKVGDPAPAGTSELVQMEKHNSVNKEEGLDVYVYCASGAGKVAVWRWQ